MTPSLEQEIREQLAAIEHERWASWQKYVHDLYRQPDGSVMIPAGHAYAWDKQIATPYAELSEREKDSDREQVDRYWPIISRHLSAVIARVEQLPSMQDEPKTMMIKHELFGAHPELGIEATMGESEGPNLKGVIRNALRAELRGELAEMKAEILGENTNAKS